MGPYPDTQPKGPDLMQPSPSSLCQQASSSRPEQPLPRPIHRLLPINDVQGHIRQTLIVMVSPPDLDQKHLDLLPRPATPARQGAERDGLQSVEQDGAPVEPDRLEHAVLGPRADGDLEHPFRDVDVATILHHILHAVVGHGVELDPQRPQSLVDERPVLRHGMIRCDGTHGDVVYFVQLEPASRAQMSCKVSRVLERGPGDTNSSDLLISFGQSLMAMTV